MVLLVLLGLACGPIALGEDGADVADTSLRTYELGWQVDACSAEMADEGTGHSEGDVLPQYELLAQTGERVRFHDFCNQVVYVEFGYFT